MLFTVQDNLNKTVLGQIAVNITTKRNTRTNHIYLNPTFYIEAKDQEILVCLTFYVNSTFLDNKTTFMRMEVSFSTVFINERSIITSSFKGSTLYKQFIWQF